MVQIDRVLFEPSLLLSTDLLLFLAAMAGLIVPPMWRGTWSSSKASLSPQQTHWLTKSVWHSLIEHHQSYEELPEKNIYTWIAKRKKKKSVPGLKMSHVLKCQ